MKQFSTRDIVQIALVAAIYVILTITPPLNAMSYGAYQFRISETLNFLAFYNRKYIISLTLGCMIANFFSFGLIDVFVGGGSTLVFVTLGVILFNKYKGQRILGSLFDKSFFIFSFFFAASMFTVAAELAIIAGLPFFLTWFTTGIGELASLLIGAVICDRVSKVIDFTR